MLRFVILLLVGLYFFYKLKPVRLKAGKKRPNVAGQGTDEIADVMEKDPVCGVYVARSSAAALKQADKTFYFCSTRCRDLFREKNNQRQS